MILEALIAAVALAAPVQDAAPQDTPPKRVRSVMLYGDEACPKPADADEVVVCANAGDSPYRIPKRFRDQPEEGPTGQAWTKRMETVEEVSRAGLPNSCSPVGIGGQTGCSLQAIQRWNRERLEQERRETAVP